MDWVEELLYATRDAECPRNFIRWAGYTALSAATRNKTYLDKFKYKLYANIYTLFVAKSGLRKSFAVSLVPKLLKPLNVVKVLDGRFSIEALMEELAAIKSNEDGNPPIMDAHGVITAEELGSFLVENEHALKILTYMYDNHYHKDFDYKLRSGSVEMKNLNLTMISATTPEDFPIYIKEKDVKGGFIARTIVVHETKRALKNPLTRRGDVIFDLDKLSEHLRNISMLEGEFQYSKEGMEYYEAWYDKYDPEDEDDPTGTNNRVGDHVLKIAMLRSLSRGTDLILSVEDIRGAINLVFEGQKTEGGPTSVVGGVQYMILKDLTQAPEYKMTKHQILLKHIRDFGADDFRKAIETLYGARAIYVNNRDGEEPTIELRPEQIEKLERFKKQREENG